MTDQQTDQKPNDPAPTDPPTPPTPPADPPKETDWKAEARKWEQRAKENKKQLDEAAPKLKAFGELEEANKTDLTKAQEKAQQYEDRMVEVLSTAVRAEIRARATGFIDPDVPFAYLDVSEFLDDKGEIDTKKIDAELASLLTSRPALAKPVGRGVPAHNPALGSSGAGEPDLDAQKAKAIKDGDWRTAMRIENQKLFTPPQQ